jgi:hypothetical protein
MKDYRKAEKLVGRSTNEPFVDFTNAASLTTQTYAQATAQIRREPELTQDEKKFLVAVERKLHLLNNRQKEQLKFRFLINIYTYIYILSICFQMPEETELLSMEIILETILWKKKPNEISFRLKK